jgi:hypothetical protein
MNYVNSNPIDENARAAEAEICAFCLTTQLPQAKQWQ